MTIRDIAELCTAKAMPLFRLMGWTWGGVNPPDSFEMEDFISRLIEGIDKQSKSTQSGRFLIQKSKDEFDVDEITVSLILYTGNWPESDD